MRIVLRHTHTHTTEAVSPFWFSPSNSFPHGSECTAAESMRSHPPHSRTNIHTARTRAHRKNFIYCELVADLQTIWRTHVSPSSTGVCVCVCDISRKFAIGTSANVVDVFVSGFHSINLMETERKRYGTVFCVTNSHTHILYDERRILDNLFQFSRRVERRVRDNGRK